jgi:CHAT domain-containing protein
MLGTEAVLGPDATRARVLAGLREASIAHVAAHARFAPGAPLDSGIVLADGQLTARDILAESVGLDLLVLSGCETGVAESLGGHEFAGLSQAFVQAGVRCLVASLWAVEDPATEQLMTSFYEHWRGGADVARALSQAQAGGPFVVSGDWTVSWE